MHRRGYELGTPIVKSLSRGRAMFGFAAKIDAIIRADRGEDR